ncbi:MAG: hypothetical protein AB7D47_01915 [Desulfovibrio sp.]|jgi:hypothetical protein
MAEKEHGDIRRFVESVDLPNDHGAMIRVSGEILAEDMHFNDSNGRLTVEKIYDAGHGRVAYAAVSAMDDGRDRRAYLIERREQRCLAGNGSITLDLDCNDLIHLLSLALTQERTAAQADTAVEHIQRRLAANA